MEKQPTSVEYHYESRSFSRRGLAAAPRLERGRFAAGVRSSGTQLVLESGKVDTRADMDTFHAIRVKRR